MVSATHLQNDFDRQVRELFRRRLDVGEALHIPRDFGQQAFDVQPSSNEVGGRTYWRCGLMWIATGAHELVEPKYAASEYGLELSRGKRCARRRSNRPTRKPACRLQSTMPKLSAKLRNNSRPSKVRTTYQFAECSTWELFFHQELQERLVPPVVGLVPTKFIGAASAAQLAKFPVELVHQVSSAAYTRLFVIIRADHCHPR